jgi:3-oxoacyl-[acyl-carrier protein] reductase
MTAADAETELGRQRMAQMPIGRFGRADEVAEAVLFLLTDASSLFTGQTLNPNGGGYMP